MTSEQDFTPGGAPKIDWQQLDLIADDYSPEFVEIFDEFMADMPGQLSELESMVASGQQLEASRAAHALKGSASNFGFVSFAAAMLRIEREGKAGGITVGVDFVQAAGADLAEAARQMRATKAF